MKNAMSVVIKCVLIGLYLACALVFRTHYDKPDDESEFRAIAGAALWPVVAAAASGEWVSERKQPRE